MSQSVALKSSYGSNSSGSMCMYEYEYEYEFITSFKTENQSSLSSSFCDSQSRKIKILGYGINLI